MDGPGVAQITRSRVAGTALRSGRSEKTPLNTVAALKLRAKQNMEAAEWHHPTRAPAKACGTAETS
jgi:hypothetical protein